MNHETVITLDSDDDASNSSSGQTQVGSSTNSSTTSTNICRVCGAERAAMHYGAFSCVGCKGFFRRALLKADQLECTSDGHCIVSHLQKIQCRSCRFNKCLREGMNPAFVRPNRDTPPKPRKPPTMITCDYTSKKTTKSREEWMKKMTVEMRTILMTLLNIETTVMKGDTNEHASKIYPLSDIDKLKDIIDNPARLKGKRTEMRYEAFRMAGNDELCSIAYRRLIAAIDWIENLSPLLGYISPDDKIAMIKSSFAPLMIFNFCARTAEVCEDADILCLCNFAYVPRNISKMYPDTYHLGNGLVERALNELVAVYREYGMKEEEIVCVSAMLCLNPLAKDVSDSLFEKIVTLRNRISDCLFSIVKEVRLSPTPNVCYGHILLSLSTVSELASAMSENLQFAQTFSVQGEVPLLTDLFGCFTVEPFFSQIDEERKLAKLSLEQEKANLNEVATQTDRIPPPRFMLKRHATVDEEGEPSRQNFRLLQPPTNFYLTEMFDDLRNNAAEQRLNNLCYDASTVYQQPPPQQSSEVLNNVGMNAEMQSQPDAQFQHPQPYEETLQTPQDQYNDWNYRNCAGPSTSYHFPTPAAYPF